MTIWHEAQELRRAALASKLRCTAYKTASERCVAIFGQSSNFSLGKFPSWRISLPLIIVRWIPQRS